MQLDSKLREEQHTTRSALLKIISIIINIIYLAKIQRPLRSQKQYVQLQVNRIKTASKYMYKSTCLKECEREGLVEGISAQVS